MIGKTPRWRTTCECGSRLQWETWPEAGGGQKWLSLCLNPDCGRVSTNPSPEPAEQSSRAGDLQEFLIGSGRPHLYTKPWIRAFLEAARLPNQHGWMPSGMRCWLCPEEDLVFYFRFAPLLVPADSVLCLRCGALSVTSIPAPGTPCTRLLGEDWINLDPAIRLFKSGIQTISSQIWADD